jgi:hypothetical protein
VANLISIVVTIYNRRSISQQTSCLPRRLTGPPSLLASAKAGSNETAHVRYWPLADIRENASNVAFGAKAYMAVTVRNVCL